MGSLSSAGGWGSRRTPYPGGSVQGWVGGRQAGPQDPVGSGASSAAPMQGEQRLAAAILGMGAVWES